MKSQRLDMIEEYVLEHKNASLDTLCEKFNVSKNTIRRDVDILLKRGSIMKVYGGVAALETPQTLPLLSYEERGGRFPDEKKEICRRAAELVAEDDTIYIDTGTTCLNLVDFIADKHCTDPDQQPAYLQQGSILSEPGYHFRSRKAEPQDPVLHRTGYQ
ncbi:MAG: DeoR family transcriptional regulator [Blautia massiliensis (ex Durand et al. 2017)]|uniref:DeoR family transcriptional regulator n=1 Tax=Blautia massiliensis (ex Durand et al. 2017) TaxID=1737424 RepID=UPI00399CA97E